MSFRAKREILPLKTEISPPSAKQPPCGVGRRNDIATTERVPVLRDSRARYEKVKKIFNDRVVMSQDEEEKTLWIRDDSAPEIKKNAPTTPVPNKK